MTSSNLRCAWPVGFLLALVACGDDTTRSTSDGGAGGEGATTTTSTSTSTPSSTSSSANGGGGTGGEATATGGGGSGGGAQASCGDGVTASDLATGAWDRRFTIAGFTGPDGFAPAVHDFAVDADGAVIAAGRFGFFGEDAVAPLMRRDDAGWAPARATWELPAPRDGFSAIAIDAEGTLALALNDSFGERDGEIWIDAGDGLTSIGAYAGQVRSLAWLGGRLWVAGLFALDDASAAENLAVWSEGAWSGAPGGAPDGPAYELTVAGGDLLVGGAFSTLGGIPAASVAAYDGEGWRPYDFPEALAVYALARTEGGELYAGGAFGEFEAASGVARWNGAAWETVGGGLGMYQTRGVVTDLVAHGEAVDATGCFNTAGGLGGAEGSVPAVRFARWVGDAWTSLDDGATGALAPWFVPATCGDEGPTAIWDVPHQRLAHDGERLYAGGFFAGVDGVLSQSIATRDDGASSWEAVGATALGLGGSLDRVAAGGPGCDVYGLGTFSHVSGAPVSARVVHHDGASWTALPDPLPRDAYCPTMDVSPDGEVAVGCLAFDDQGARGVVLRREGDVMVEAPIAGLDGVFFVQWGDDGALWVAGGSSTGFVGRIEGDTLTILEDGFDGPVDHLAITQADDLVASGPFQHVGDVDASRIARFAGDAWEPLGEGIPGQVVAMTRVDDDVFVSSYDEGAGAYLLGRYGLADAVPAWEELAGDAGVMPVSFFSFNALTPIPGGLLAVGTVEMDDGSGRGALVYVDGTFTPLGGGVGAIGVYGAAVTDDAVWIAGVIGDADPEGAIVSSVGVARWVFAVR